MGTYAIAVPEPLDARERRELCDLFGDLGADAPTCCEGWTTLDLAAHLVVRERKPLAAPGILLGGRFQARLDRATAKVIAEGYDAVVEKVRNGPPIGPFAVPGLRTLINLNEYVVHHEDVRRANGLGPRTDRPDLQDALWRVLRRGAGLQLRSVRKQLTVRLARGDADHDGADHDGGDDVRVGSGPEVTVTGDPVELVLYLMGRKTVAQVELVGDPASVAVLQAASLGI
jgi:uncharacterized protein (TIGR03085 family)